MISNSLKTYISSAIIIFGFMTVFGLSNYLESSRPAVPEEWLDEDLSLQGEKLKGFSLGFEGLIADWYWIQSLQYMGEVVARSEDEVIDLENLQKLNPRLLYPLLDNATTLDPQFMAAYSYGAVVLPAIDSDQAISFTEKGIKNNPESWRLYQHLGYIHWRLKDYQKAAEVYENGSQIQGSPPFMKLMAARMKGEQSESRETAREIYQQMKESDDQNIKDIAALRLMQLDAFDQLDAINKALNEFKEKNRRCAQNLREIQPSLLKIKLPGGNDFRVDRANNLVDPSDAPYLLNKKDCTANLDFAKTKIPSQ